MVVALRCFFILMTIVPAAIAQSSDALFQTRCPAPQRRANRPSWNGWSDAAGIWGDFPGGFWGVHGFSVDQEGNFYVAEVDNGRVQKFRPRQGVNPAYLVSKQFYSAWK
jgi:hypothetical protein